VSEATVALLGALIGALSGLGAAWLKTRFPAKCGKRSTASSRSKRGSSPRGGVDETAGAREQGQACCKARAGLLAGEGSPSKKMAQVGSPAVLSILWTITLTPRGASLVSKERFP